MIKALCVCGLRLLGPIYTASLAVSLVGFGVTFLSIHSPVNINASAQVVGKGLRGIRMYQGYVMLKFLEGSPVGSLLDSTPL